MKVNAILVNPYCKDYFGTYSNNTYLAALQKAAFEKAGISNFHILPNQPFKIETDKRDSESYNKEFLFKFIKEFRNTISTDYDTINVVGITHYAENPGIGIELAKIAKYLLPHRVIIIGGGPFFSEKRKFDGVVDPVRHVLNVELETGTKVYSSVVFGGFQGYLNVLNLSSGGNAIMNGIYFIDSRNREIIGNGRSENPEMEYGPFIYSKDNVSQYFASMFSNFCENRCFFCKTGYPFRFSVEQIAEGLDRTQVPNEPFRFKLKDPNPLSAANREHTYECMELVNFKFGNPVKSIYLDSILLREPRKLWQNIRDLNIIEFFVGMDATSKYANELIGSCSNGISKNQQDIESELDGLEKIIILTKESKRPFFYQPSFILSPNETKETLEYTLLRMKKLRDLGGEYHFVKPIAFLLLPFPGTRLLETHADMIAQDPFFIADDSLKWNRAAIKSKYPDSVFDKVMEVSIILNQNKRNFEGALKIVKA